MKILEREQKKEPTVSVITPVYNVEMYLDTCIKSILRQSFSDFELILIDDGSTDNSLSICSAYANKDRRIHVLTQTNHGQAFARNRGIDYSHGDYLAFVDSDDYIHPQYLEILVSNLKKHQANIAICSFIKGDKRNYKWEHFCCDDESCCKYNGKSFLRESIEKNSNKIWVLWDKLFRKDCFKQIRLPENRIYEDNAVVYKLLYSANYVVDVDLSLYYYYENSNGTTELASPDKKLDWLLVLDEMAAFFYDKKEVELYNKYRKQYLQDALFLYKQMVDCMPNASKTKELKENIIKRYKNDKEELNLNADYSFSLYEFVYPSRAKIYSIIKRPLKLIKRIKR